MCYSNIAAKTYNDVQLSRAAISNCSVCTNEDSLTKLNVGAAPTDISLTAFLINTAKSD